MSRKTTRTKTAGPQRDPDLKPLDSRARQSRGAKEQAAKASTDKVQKHVRLDPSVVAQVVAHAQRQDVSFDDYVNAAIVDRLRHDAGYTDTPDPLNVRLNQLIDATQRLDNTVTHDSGMIIEMLRAITDLARGDSTLADKPMDEILHLRAGERIIDPHHASGDDAS